MNQPLLDRRTFDSAELMYRYPPRWQDRNKAAVSQKLLAAGDEVAGSLEVSRWGAAALPDRCGPHRAIVEPRRGFFLYGEAAPPGMHWHVNFAMDDCFGAYAGRLLAQDELQVLEHPVLASLREAALDQGFSIHCQTSEGPTPLLVAGAERRGALDTRPSTAAPQGLYGNEFARAPSEVVTAAVARLAPPPISNILAIEAPAFGRGTYRAVEVEAILRTAYSGFLAAARETAHLRPGRATVLHTGWWGCGAYGGNKELMAAVQLLAADLAGIDHLEFYAIDAAGEAVFAQASRVHDEVRRLAEVSVVVEALVARGYQWGVSNGT